MQRRRRLDVELVRRGLVDSRVQAQEAIAAGLVTVDGAPALKAASQVLPGEALTVHAPPRRYVSRGGEKLAGALERFGVDPTGRRCLDAGVSTGGFTDCLLQAGADHVVAVDVGYGQVHERLRRDDRVTIRERTNVRELGPGELPGAPADLVVADLSFIALAVVLPVLRALAAPDAEAVVLVKPQFEAGPDEVGKGGVVRDPEVWRRVLHAVVATAADVGWELAGAMASPLLGPAGNVEFPVHLVAAGVGDGDAGRTPRSGSVSAEIDSAVAEGIDLRRER